MYFDLSVSLLASPPLELVLPPPKRTPGTTVNEREDGGRGKTAEKIIEAAESAVAAGGRGLVAAAAATATGETRGREREIAQHKLGVWKRLAAAAAARATAAAATTQGRK